MSGLVGSQSNDANKDGSKPLSANKSHKLSNIISNSSSLKPVLGLILEGDVLASAALP